MILRWRFLEFIPPSLRSQAFLGRHSHDEDALVVFVSALDCCLLALIAPFSDVPLLVTME